VSQTFLPSVSFSSSTSTTTSSSLLFPHSSWIHHPQSCTHPFIINMIYYFWSRPTDTTTQCSILLFWEYTFNIHLIILPPLLYVWYVWCGVGIFLWKAENSWKYWKAMRSKEERGWLRASNPRPSRHLDWIKETVRNLRPHMHHYAFDWPSSLLFSFSFMSLWQKIEIIWFWSVFFLFFFYSDFFGFSSWVLSNTAAFALVVGSQNVFLDQQIGLSW
jgi:hypothetical protein